MLNLLRGLGVPAFVVGAARGILEAGLMAALGEALVLLPQVDWGNYALASPFVYGGIRAVEGIIDHIDPAKKRAPA
jgi:hypothetical protein